MILLFMISLFMISSSTSVDPEKAKIPAGNGYDNLNNGLLCNPETYISCQNSRDFDSLFMILLFEYFSIPPASTKTRS